MKATEANQLAMDSCKDEIKEILDLIKQSAQMGETELNSTDLLKGGTESYLINLGYCVEIKFIELQGERKILQSFRIKWNNS